MIEKLLGLPLNASAHGGRIDLLILLVHVLMAVLFVGWTAFFLYVLVRFRKGRHPHADAAGMKSHASTYLEVTVAVIEVALLVGLSMPFWSWKVSAFPTEPDTVRIRVVAQQFAWNVHYPGPDGKFGRTELKLVDEQTNPIGLDRNDPDAKDDIVLINQLHIPVDRPIIIELSTKDVIHSFSLPYFRVKQDTIPGMIIPVHFRATVTSDRMREQLARTVRLPATGKFDGYIAMQDYAGKDGQVVLKKGRAVTGEVLAKLAENGVPEIQIGPRYTAEIACAQLCGLGHYRMKGFVTVHDEKGYQQWLNEQEEDLQQ